METPQVRNDKKFKSANWTKGLDKVFIGLAYEQTLKGNKPGTSFNKAGWKFIREEFFKRTGYNYSHQQLKNHFNALRPKWKAWNKLIGLAGFCWDPVKKVVIAEDECWADYIKENPDAEKFKTSTCPMYEEMCLIFNGTNATGAIALAPSQVEDEGGPSHLENLDVSTPSTSFEGLSSGVGTSDDVGGTPREYVGGSQCKRPSDTLLGSCQISREPRASKLSQTMATLGEDLKGKILASAQSSVTALDPLSITSCIRVLQELEGVDHESMVFYRALEMFQNPGWRECFIALTPQQRLGWLKTLDPK